MITNLPNLFPCNNYQENMLKNYDIIALKDLLNGSYINFESALFQDNLVKLYDNKLVIGQDESIKYSINSSSLTLYFPTASPIVEIVKFCKENPHQTGRAILQEGDSILIGNAKFLVEQITSDIFSIFTLPNASNEIYESKKKEKVCKICLEEENNNLERPFLKYDVCSCSSYHESCFEAYIKVKLQTVDNIFTDKEKIIFNNAIKQELYCEVCKSKIKHEKFLLEKMGKSFSSGSKFVKLKFKSELFAEKQIFLKLNKREEVTLGKTNYKADIPIIDFGVSGLHCKIFLSEEGDLCVEDLNSTFGTFVQRNPKRFENGYLINTCMKTFLYRNFMLRIIKKKQSIIY